MPCIKKYILFVIAKVNVLIKIKKVVTYVKNIKNCSSIEEFWHNNKSKNTSLLSVLILQEELCADSIETILLIKKKNPNIKIILLSTKPKPSNIFYSFRAGAVGYIFIKDIDNLDEYIKKVANNETAISPSATQSLIEYIINSPKNNHKLTNKETQVFRLLTQGYSNKEIAQIYQTSIYTVRTQVRNIMKKLNVNDRTQLMIKAKDVGFM